VALGAGVLLLPLLVKLFGRPVFRSRRAGRAFGCGGDRRGLIVTERVQQRAMADPATGLPTSRRYARRPPAAAAPNIVVGRIDRFAAIASGLGPSATANLLLRVADRLRFANHQATIYRTDDATLAWIEEGADEESLAERIEAITALMRSPVDCGRLIDVALTFGLASGSSPLSNSSPRPPSRPRRPPRRAFAGSASLKPTARRPIARFRCLANSTRRWRAASSGTRISPNSISRRPDHRRRALVRWQHPLFGAITPDQFIPIIEEHHRVGDLTVFVLEQAIEDALGWGESGHPIGVAVNVSATLSPTTPLSSGSPASSRRAACRPSESRSK
jgi:GGDEF domain-containing protein